MPLELLAERLEVGALRLVRDGAVVDRAGAGVEVACPDPQFVS